MLQKKEAEMKVEDVMTREVISVRPETSLKEVASILAEKGISGVPVVDEAGELVGVVSEGDIVFKERPPSSRRGMLAWLLDPYGMEGQLKLEARTVGAAAAEMVDARQPPAGRRYRGEAGRHRHARPSSRAQISCVGSSAPMRLPRGRSSRTCCNGRSGSTRLPSRSQ
jgi:hypothetical protein